MKPHHSILALGLAGCLLASIFLPLTLSSAQSARAGLRLQFAALSSSGGMRGEAFLPISGRHIEAKKEAGSAPCASGPELRFEAKHPSAYVRSVSVSLRGEASSYTIGASNCPSAVVEATLEDGTILRGGKGKLSVDRSTAGELSGELEWTPVHESEPLPFRGNFAFKLPRR